MHTIPPVSHPAYTYTYTYTTTITYTYTYTYTTWLGGWCLWSVELLILSRKTRGNAGKMDNAKYQIP